MINAAQLRAALEQHRSANFQGNRNMKPLRLVDKVFGDGRQLVTLHPPNSGPNYYVVRVDSSWQLSDQGMGGSLFSDHIGAVIEAIEAQFGSAWYVGDPVKRLDNGQPFSPTKEDCGCRWFSLKWPEGLQPPSIPAAATAEIVESPAP